MVSYDQLLIESTLTAASNQLPVNPGSLIFFGIFLMAVGAVSIICPQVFWYLRIGRKIPGVPPNRLYLWVLRFGGLLVIALGAIILFITGTISL